MPMSITYSFDARDKIVLSEDGALKIHSYDSMGETVAIFKNFDRVVKNEQRIEVLVYENN